MATVICCLLLSSLTGEHRRPILFSSAVLHQWPWLPLGTFPSLLCCGDLLGWKHAISSRRRGGPAPKIGLAGWKKSPPGGSNFPPGGVQFSRLGPRLPRGGVPQGTILDGLGLVGWKEKIIVLIFVVQLYLFAAQAPPCAAWTPFSEPRGMRHVWCPRLLPPGHGTPF